MVIHSMNSLLNPLLALRTVGAICVVPGTQYSVLKTCGAGLLVSALLLMPDVCILACERLKMRCGTRYVPDLG